jgi:hypothetical protein
MPSKVTQAALDVADLFEALHNKPAAKAVRMAGLCGTVHHAAADFLAAYAARHRAAGMEQAAVIADTFAIDWTAGIDENIERLCTTIRKAAIRQAIGADNGR